MVSKCVSIPKGSIKSGDLEIGHVGLAVFQFQKVRLKANLGDGICRAAFVFQFQKVRLKGCNDKKDYLSHLAVSIPKGSIKRKFLSTINAIYVSFNSKRFD